VVEEPFQFRLPEGVRVGSDHRGDDRNLVVGEGCYISTTVHNRRYYGVLIDQASLKSASMLHFRDEASGLELNRRMEAKLREEEEDDTVGGSDSHMDDDGDDIRKRPAVDSLDTIGGQKKKRIKLNGGGSDAIQLNSTIGSPSNPVNTRQVQRFRYVKQDSAVSGHNKSVPGYRVLLATYLDGNAAAENDPVKANLINTACELGGDFVGEYFYQYEVGLP
jgi:hypothetical protein